MNILTTMENVSLKCKKNFITSFGQHQMTSSAKKYLISDSGLRKICRKYEISLQKAGHWEKLRAGKEVDIIELPTDYKGENEITLTLRSESDSSIIGRLSPEEELRDEITFCYW